MPSSTRPIEVKEVYSASKRGRDRWWAGPRRDVTGGSRLVLLGLLNLAAAGGLYYGTWWQADPELRYLVIMHTPLPGVNVEEAANVIGPDLERDSFPQQAARREASDTKAQTAQAARFVGTCAGWELLASLAACALALSGGALLGQAGVPRLKRGALLLGLAALVAIGWVAVALWMRYERLVPDQLRTDIGALVLIFALTGLAAGRGARNLTLLAATALIISACGSVFTLYVLARFGAVKPVDLPLPLIPTLGLVFVIHSLWGWVLLPVARRIGR